MHYVLVFSVLYYVALRKANAPVRWLWILCWFGVSWPSLAYGGVYGILAAGAGLVALSLAATTICHRRRPTETTTPQAVTAREEDVRP